MVQQLRVLVMNRHVLVLVLILDGGMETDIAVRVYDFRKEG